MLVSGTLKSVILVGLAGWLAARNEEEEEALRHATEMSHPSVKWCSGGGGGRVREGGVRDTSQSCGGSGGRGGGRRGRDDTAPEIERNGLQNKPHKVPVQILEGLFFCLNRSLLARLCRHP